MALVVLLPTFLLIVSTVYCQMHYVVDAGIGLVLGVVAGVVVVRASTAGEPAARQSIA